jgi:type IV secretion system protein VirB5
VLRKNPLGIYVDAVDWSRELDTASVPPAAPPPTARSVGDLPASLPLGSPLDPNLGAQPTNIQETNP